MKLMVFKLLLCVAPWAIGKEYIYRLNAISLSDIPDLGPQAAGIKLSSQLTVQSREVNSIIIKLVDITTSSFHNDVEDAWNLLEAAVGSPFRIDGKMHMEKPFIIRHRDGLFESLSVTQDEPLWSINLKRAIASQLQLHVSGSRSVESASRNFSFDAENGEVNAIFKVLEDGVTGECETLYEIAPLSDALIRSDSKLNPMPHLCTQGSYFQVVKTADYSKCRVKPIYNVIAPSGWSCKPGASTCSSAVSRSSVTRYIACGLLESFTLLKLVHQGELRANPYGYDTEQLRDFSIMKMVLHAVRPVSSSASKEINASLTINSLVYSFVDKVSDASRMGGRLRMPPLREIDKSHRTSNLSGLKVEVRHILDAIERISTRNEDVASRGVLDAIGSVSQLIRSLDYHEIVTLFNDLTLVSSSNGNSKTHVVRSILLDAITAAGSNPAVMFIKDSIISQQLTRSESIQALSGLPLSVRTPTPDLLNELLVLLRTTNTFPDRTIFHMASIAVSKLIHTACVNLTEARTRFPIELYGNFCSADDPIVIRELVPFLAQGISSSRKVEDRMVALTALGEVGHESIIPLVIPVIEGKVDYSSMIRAKAVISLHKLAHDSNERVIHILATIYQNPSESNEVRMAAFTLLVLANPPAFRWQKMALSTWFEPSAQMASFVYTTLYSLANLALPLENLKDVSEKAQAVLPLAKPVPLGLKYSYNLKWSNFLPEHNAGAEFHHELFNSKESLLPKSFYSRLSWALGPYHFDVFELETYFENLKNAWDRLRIKFFPQSSGGSADSTNEESRPKNPRFHDYEWHSDLQWMKKQLNAKIPDISQESNTPEAFVHLSLMKAIHQYASLDETSFRSVIQGLSRVRQSLEGEGMNLRWHKWMPLSNFEVAMPNTLGFLVTTRVHAQTLSLFKGNLRLSEESVDSPRKGESTTRYSQFPSISFDVSSLELDAKPMITFKLLAKMEVDVGFTRYVTVSGVDSSLMASLPGITKIGLDWEKWKLLLSWKPTVTEPTTLYRYSVRPFTSLYLNSDVIPVLSSPYTREVAAAGGTLQTHQQTFGANFGLKLVSKEQSESPSGEKVTWARSSSNSDKLTAVNFAILPLTLRRKLYSVTLDPMASETKEIIFYLNLDAAKKSYSNFKVPRSGSKSPPPFKRSADRFHVLSNNVENSIRRKLTRVLERINEGASIHLDAKLILEGESTRVYSASIAGACSTECTHLAIHSQISFPLNGESSEIFTLCAEGDGSYPWLPAVKRQELIDRKLEAKWSAKIGYGASCNDRQLNFTANLKRSNELTQRIRDLAENRDCHMHESRGEVNHEKCLMVKELAFILDEYDITVHYENVLAKVLNASMAAERFLKTWLYPYLSENELGIFNGEGTMRIWAKVRDSLDAVTVVLFKPRSNTFFNNIPLNNIVNVIFPLSARSSLTDRIIDFTLNNGNTPVCRIEKKSITTFDRVHYSTQLNDCEHVALAIPGTDSIAVLIRQEADNKIVTLLVGKNKLEVDAFSQTVRFNDIDVVVSEDQPIEIHEDRESGHLQVAAIHKLAQRTFKMVTVVYGIQIVTNGNSITIEASRTYHGKLTGLCGNMDGEMVSELQDPRHCILSSGLVMTASYMITDRQSKCSSISEEIRNQLRQEQALCIKYAPYPFTVTGSNSTTSPCSMPRTMVVTRGNMSCFSTMMIPQCKSSCQPSGTMAKNVGFHCIEDPKLAEMMEQEAQVRPISSMVGKREDFRTTIYAPTGCQPK